jgi:thiol-disulfide isomerase/thioredoxin
MLISLKLIFLPEFIIIILKTEVNCSKDISIMNKTEYLNNYICLLIATYLMLFSFSCNSPGIKKDISSVKSDSLVNAFKPQPQKLKKQDVKTLEIGTIAPDFYLPGVNGKFYSLKDFRDAKVLVVIFTCNHCPTAQAYEGRIIKFTEEYKDRGVSVVAIMPNSTFSLLPEECGYSDLDDSYESMVIRAKDKSFNFPYLYDGDNQAVSIQYGPAATPHAFVFDKRHRLVYTGRIDDSEKPGTGNAEDLRSAVNALLAGKTIENPVNKAFGCSVKWAWKTEWTDKVNNDWNNKMVMLLEVDRDFLKYIIANKSDKLRLVNVWATWCAPCVIEYPELIKLHRMYRNRAFEFVSVSADKPEKRDDVLKFLQSNNSAIRNYIYKSDNSYELIESIDPQWSGAIPYTLLIEPEGNIIYKNQGITDILKIRKIIVEHPLLGRYY